jgi:hypothetical protein
VDIPVAGEDSDRWLFVEQVKAGAQGAWASGSFDVERNRLTIRTNDVRRFRVAVSRIEIDWTRPVVLRLDGVNSELRRRPHADYHFFRDDHGLWVVSEP